MNNHRLTRLTACLLALVLMLPAGALAETPGRSLRLHYVNQQNDYADLGFWSWGGVATPSEQVAAWPDGRTLFPPENIQADSAFVDLPLLNDALDVGVLVIDSAGNKQTPEDVIIPLPSPELQEVWLNDALVVSFEDLRAIPDGHVRVRYFVEDGAYNDLGVWFWGDVTTPSEQVGAWPVGATPLTPAEGPLGAYADIPLSPDAKQVGFLLVNRQDGTQTADYAFDFTEGARVNYLKQGDDTVRLNPYQLAAPEAKAAPAPWVDIDANYVTTADLGPQLLKNGAAVLRLWAPTAERVEVVLYDKADQYTVVQDALPMLKGDKGVWQTTLHQSNTGVADLTGYYYHFRVTRGGESRLVLNPYAPSMAAWNSQNDRGETVGKAALVNPAAIGPQLHYANIPGYVDREDAIIYEAHIRDFTSHPAIADDLTAPYGTFTAFAERLDYLKDLGVTHIQLLPVLNYYHVNELDRERSPHYASENENYNWGYDPHSWFALTGMYATDPNDPSKRIEEFKQLVDLIHQKGMGVILDVVYNHTAFVELLDDIEPNYYYFLDAQGRPKGSFGGGQVGSTHLMARKLIIDSLRFLTDTYKVDGFRFDMMGSLDADTLTMAWEEVGPLNPNALWLGEGWRTFNGDHGVTGVPSASQDWMGDTDQVSVFSDEVRNELKSGFGSEGQPRFLTGGTRSIALLYDNIIARPGNVSEDDPGDIVQYIAAHDNLTLHDVIAHSIKKDPDTHQDEILRRQRLGNALLLTHQGIIFLHSGQEYGRTKQFRHPDYMGPVDTPPAKSTYMLDADGQPFTYPYFIHDSYNSSDAVNAFDWDTAMNSPAHRRTLDYTRGLIALRRATDAFSYATADTIDTQIKRIITPDIRDSDLLLAFTAASQDTGDIYLVAVNADSKPRTLSLTDHAFDLSRTQVLVDGETAGTQPIEAPVDVTLAPSSQDDALLGQIELAPLTAVVLRVAE